MKTLTRTLVAVCIFCRLSVLAADEYKAEKLTDPAPSATLSKEVADKLGATGIRVSRDGMPFCDLWLCKSWVAIADFKPTAEVAFPFKPGDLIGVVKYVKRGSDFRDQDIKTGLYTLRYAQQPVNGAHVGTSLTRDFCLLTEAAKDKSGAVVDYETLTKRSSEAAGSAHPALLCLLKPASDGAAPGIRHDEEHDWWVVSFQSQLEKDKTPLAVEMVVVGKAAE